MSLVCRLSTTTRRAPSDMSAQAALYTHLDDALQQDYSTHSTFTTPQDVLHDVSLSSKVVDEG